MPFASDNAVVKLSKVIQRLANFPQRIRTDYVKILTEKMPISRFTKWLLGKAIFMPYVLRYLERKDPAQAKLLHAISQMTISPNVTQGGTKTNVVPSRAYVDLDIRRLPGQTVDYVMDRIRHHLKSLSYEVKVELIPIAHYEPIEGNESSLTSPMIPAMESVLKDIHGVKAELVPLFSPGQTDSRFFRNEFGTDAYGFSVFDDRMSGNELVAMPHSSNERVSLGTLDLTYKAYKSLVTNLLG